MVELVLLPDVERMVATVLRAADELAGLDDRIYTVTPREVGGLPFVLVRRVGGEPAVGYPLVLDAAAVQADCYGGTKQQAGVWARTVQHVLSELAGTFDDGMFTGHVTGVRLGALRYLPDEAFEPARPRYVLDVDVFVKRGGLVEPAGTTAAAVTATGSTDR